MALNVVAHTETFFVRVNSAMASSSALRLARRAIQSARRWDDFPRFSLPAVSSEIADFPRSSAPCLSGQTKQPGFPSMQPEPSFAHRNLWLQRSVFHGSVGIMNCALGSVSIQPDLPSMAASQCQNTPTPSLRRHMMSLVGSISNKSKSAIEIIHNAWHENSSFVHAVVTS